MLSNVIAKARKIRSNRVVEFLFDAKDQVMGCFSIRLNTLPSIWYTACMLSIQAYLLYLALARYKLYTEIKWTNGGYPKMQLTIYISLLGACIPLLFLFTIFGLFQTGNLGSDNKKLDCKEKHISRWGHQKSEQSCLCRFIKSCWRHSPPIAQSLHVISALCQLIAQQLMIAQLFRHGFINSGDFLNTELDAFYQRSRQLATNLPMGDTRLQGFRITSDELANSPLSPNLLPILMHARLFGISLEFVNLVIALISYSCVYASVFWKLNKCFSLIFTSHLITHSIDVIFSYLSFSVLYRIQETNYQTIRPVGLTQYLAATSQLIVYHPLVVLGTFIANLFFMHVTPIILYAYGYSKFIDAIRYVNHHGPHSPPINVGLLDDYDGRQNRARSPTNICCNGYIPHMGAVVLLLIIVTVKAPMIYYILLLINNHEIQPFLLSCFAVDAFYLLSWLCLWCFLAVKHSWDFKITLPTFMYKPNLTAITNPPPPSNLFDPYRRTIQEENATVYKPDSYASIRRPLRPAGLVFAHGSEANDYTSFEAYGQMGTLRTSPNNFREPNPPYTAQVYSPKQKPAKHSSKKPQIITTNLTRPIIMGTHSEKPVLWGLQQNPRPLLVNGTNEHPRMTPSSTLTSQTSNTSSFNNNPQEQNEAATLLNVDGSTTTLTNIGNSSFATSVV